MNDHLIELILTFISFHSIAPRDTTIDTLSTSRWVGTLIIVFVKITTAIGEWSSDFFQISYEKITVSLRCRTGFPRPSSLALSNRSLVAINSSHLSPFPVYLFPLDFPLAVYFLRTENVIVHSYAKEEKYWRSSGSNPRDFPESRRRASIRDRFRLSSVREMPRELSLTRKGKRFLALNKARHDDRPNGKRNACFSFRFSFVSTRPLFPSGLNEIRGWFVPRSKIPERERKRRSRRSRLIETWNGFANDTAVSFEDFVSGFRAPSTNRLRKNARRFAWILPRTVRCSKDDRGNVTGTRGITLTPSDHP